MFFRLACCLSDTTAWGIGRSVGWLVVGEQIISYLYAFSIHISGSFVRCSVGCVQIRSSSVLSPLFFCPLLLFPSLVSRLLGTYLRCRALFCQMWAGQDRTSGDAPVFALSPSKIIRIHFAIFLICNSVASHLGLYYTYLESKVYAVSCFRIYL